MKHADSFVLVFTAWALWCVIAKGGVINADKMTFMTIGSWTGKLTMSVTVYDCQHWTFYDKPSYN
jgi:hypothetical protein